MKISFVLPDKYPHIGGFENVVTALVNQLRLKAEIHVLCTGVIEERVVPGQAQVLPILRASKIRYIGSATTILLNMFAVLRYLIREKPDIVHANPCYPSGLFAVSARFLGIPLVCTSHGGDIQKDAEIGYGYRLNPFHSLLIRFTLKYVDRHTLVSNSLREDAIEAGSTPLKLRVVYNGIDTQETDPNCDESFEERFGIDRNDFLVLYLGRLHPKKRPMDLIEAIPHLIRSVPNAKILFAGVGEEHHRLEMSISQLGIGRHVRLVGRVNEEDKWRLLNRSHVFVLPSTVEAFGIALVEAMACGTAVVATRTGPFIEIVRDGETGLLVPPMAPKALSDAIVRLAKDDHLRLEIGQHAKEDARRRFDIRTISEEYFEIYREAISSKRG